MSKDLYEEFPYIVANDIIIRKMTENDADALMELCSSEAVYRYAPDFMTTKNKKAVIRNISQIGGRDFEKKLYIIAGVYLQEDPNNIIATAEIFGYDKLVSMAEIGYRINERYWNRGIATKVTQALVAYLFDEIGLNRIQAKVMPENIYSAKVLLKNGFLREGLIRQGNFWKGRGVVDLDMYSLLKVDYMEK
ncbi:N-acetyltransferase [bacterium 1xD8-6]|nr:N-acetyltransferase [bacterium D16-36]RKI73271.1 N-acetyltransferase [bacterium 1xD8-6]